MANQGQLKFLAVKALAWKFYAGLIEADYTDAPPWEASEDDLDNYAAANIGQVKNLFKIDLTLFLDGDSLPD